MNGRRWMKSGLNKIRSAYLAKMLRLLPIQDHGVINVIHGDDICFIDEQILIRSYDSLT